MQPADPGGRLRPGNVWLNAIVPSVVNVIGQAGFGVCPYYVPASTLGFILRLSFLFTILFGSSCSWPRSGYWAASPPFGRGWPSACWALC